MSESPQYEAFRAFARATIAHEVLKATQPLHEEIRSLRTQLETRAAQVIEGPPGKDGKDGAAGRDGVDGKNGLDGKDGIDGKPGERGVDGIIGRDGKDGLNGKDGATGDKGERGADGIATRAELDAWFEQRAADLEARNLADVFQGTYDHSKSYLRGQLVMWDGQSWMADAATRAVPGVSSDWRLFAKKGRDGRDRSK